MSSATINNTLGRSAVATPPNVQANSRARVVFSIKSNDFTRFSSEWLGNSSTTANRGRQILTDILQLARVLSTKLHIRRFQRFFTTLVVLNPAQQQDPSVSWCFPEKLDDFARPPMASDSAVSAGRWTRSFRESLETQRSARVGSGDFFCDRPQSIRYRFITLRKADADAFVAMLPIQIVIAKKEIVARNNQNISCFKSFVEFA